MKSFKLTLSAGIIGLMLTLLSAVVIAQNTKTEMHPQNDWTGLYGGFNVGGTFNKVDLNSNHFGLTAPTGTCNVNTHFSSVFPGVQLGYSRQFQSRLVLGVESDFTYNAEQSVKLRCSCPITQGVADNYTIKNRLQGSIRSQLGYSVQSNVLPFISAGVSFADLGMAYNNEGGNFYSITKTQYGWLFGAGLEWGFAQAWSIRAEYYYVDYNSMNMNITNIYGLYDPNGSAHGNLSTNNIRLAVNRRF